MHNAHHNPHVFEFCMVHTKLLDTLSNGNEGLDFILKSLNDYLMLKRRAFPRFYFLSNDELVLILSNSQDIITIQKYIIKCFEAITGVIIEGKNIVGMVSPEGEKVRFESPVGLYSGNEIQSIEIWMIDLEKEMRNSLQILLVKALKEYPNQELAQWTRS